VVPREELFDLIFDPFERNNLATDARYGGTLREMDEADKRPRFERSNSPFSRSSHRTSGSGFTKRVSTLRTCMRDKAAIGGNDMNRADRDQKNLYGIERSKSSYGRCKSRCSCHSLPLWKIHVTYRRSIPQTRRLLHGDGNNVFSTEPELLDSCTIRGRLRMRERFGRRMVASSSRTDAAPDCWHIL